MPAIPRGPIGFRLANELDGILQGISGDGLITEVEVDRLRRWLAANREFSDVQPFGHLAEHVDAALRDGRLDPDELEDLQFVVSKLTTVNPHFDAMRSGIQVLTGMLTGLSADAAISDAEVRALADWIESWSHLRGLWPYDECESLATAILSTRMAEPGSSMILRLAGSFPVAGVTEHGELLPPLISGICAVDPTIDLRDRCFVVTGDSARCERADFERQIVTRGGSVHKVVSEKTHYLVVCDGGSPHWAFACYGRKVERACELRRAGHPIVIVHESDFWDSLR